MLFFFMVDPVGVSLRISVTVSCPLEQVVDFHQTCMVISFGQSLRAD